MLSWCCHDVVMKVFECDDVVMMLSLVGFVGLGPDDESQRRRGGGCRQGGATWDSSARACPELLSRPDQSGEGVQGAAEQNQPPPAVGQTRLQARLSQWAEVWPSRSLQELHCCLSAVVGHEGLRPHERCIAVVGVRSLIGSYDSRERERDFQDGYWWDSEVCLGVKSIDHFDVQRWLTDRNRKEEDQCTMWHSTIYSSVCILYRALHCIALHCIALRALLNRSMCRIYTKHSGCLDPYFPE